MTVAEPLYPRVAAFFYGTPWAILPEKLAVMESLLRLRMAGGHIGEAEIAAVVGARRDRGGGPARPSGAVAVLPIHGVISQRADLMTESSGGTSTEALTRGLRLALADPEVGGIVLDVDSPGGSVFGIEELASEIAAANRQKPIVAVANSQAASAAYWLASAAGELSVTPSGEVGSIGVIAAHQDVSGMQEQLGVTTSLITAGKYKGEGNPYEPLGDEARTALQARVDDYYGAFTRAVAKGRRVTVDAVRGGFGEGRMLGAHAAVIQGMADRVETLDQAIARMQAMLAGGGRAGGNVAASVWLPPIAVAMEDTPAAPLVAGPIAPHETATTDAAWDGPANEARLSNDAGEATYRRAYAWQDDGADPDTKAAYRFLHHMVGADGAVGAANTKACSTGIGVLNGGRGGTTIPAADREGVHRHLAKHLQDAGMEPPPLALGAVLHDADPEPELPPLPDVAAPQESAASASDDADLRRRRLRLREHAR